jgi:two-component system sensor histidine kinase HydH
MERTQKLQELGTILTPALAHDLKNLLAAISSLSQLCVERMNPTSPLEEHLRMIYENSQRADQLIAGYLDFVRTLKYDTSAREPINIHEVIQKMWEVAESAAPPRHISFATRFDKNLPKFMGDPEKMERLLLNLFLNAIQAIPKKGRVNVRTRFLASQRVIEILIADTGTGIPRKYRKRIFEPFFTTKQGGTGLGLCACREIIEQFGGNIRIDSFPKQETKVYIRLPVPVNRR